LHAAKSRAAAPADTWPCNSGTKSIPMALPSDLIDLLAEFAATGVDYLLVGGQAVALHGAQLEALPRRRHALREDGAELPRTHPSRMRVAMACVKLAPPLVQIAALRIEWS